MTKVILLTKDCRMCDDNRHNEYGDPCMECHTYREKQDALLIVERIKERIDWLNGEQQVFDSKYVKEITLELNQITKIING